METSFDINLVKWLTKFACVAYSTAKEVVTNRYKSCVCRQLYIDSQEKIWHYKGYILI